MRTALLPHLATLVVLAGPLACGPAPDATTPVKPAGETPTSKPGTAAGPRLDLKPVPEPADLVSTVRWKSPAATLSHASGCAGVAAQLFDAGLKVGVAEILKDSMRGMADTRQLSELIALDAPVDAAVSLEPGSNPRAFTAVAIGLTSLERAKQAVESVSRPTELAPGMWKIGGKERRDVTCAIVASAGPTPARLVCGAREKDLVALGPYLARTVPTLPAPAADLHGEARFAPVDARFGVQAKQFLRQLPMIVKGEVSFGDPRYDDALVEAATGLQEEIVALMGDLDKVTIDAGVSTSSCVTTASAALQLKGKKSWLAETIADRPERAGPPPPIFWRAPKDSDSAFYARGSDPARYQKIVKTLRTLLEGALTKQKVGSAADRKALSELITLPLGKDTNTVQVSGHIDVTPPKAGAKPTAQQNFDSFMGAMFGWHLLGVTEGPESLTKFLKDVVAVYNRAPLLAPVKKSMREDAKMLPSIRTTAAPKELGPGSMAVEIKFTEIPEPGADRDFGPRPKGAKPPPKKKVTLTVHLLLMADGANTWLAFGSQKDELVKRLVSVKTGAPDASTLSARPGLEALKSSKNMSGGYFTLVPLVKMVGAGVGFASTMDPSDTPPPELGQFLATVNNLPNRGETPILTTTQLTAGGAPRSEITISLPKGAAEDLAKVAMTAVAMATAPRGMQPPPP